MGANQSQGGMEPLKQPQIASCKVVIGGGYKMKPGLGSWSAPRF